MHARKSKNIPHAKHADICMHFSFAVFPQHLKYAVGRRVALPGVLSRRTLTLSLLMRELPGFKAALRSEGEGANI